jgi:hypothetical protein
VKSQEDHEKLHMITDFKEMGQRKRVQEIKGGGQKAKSLTSRVIQWEP